MIQHRTDDLSPEVSLERDLGRADFDFDALEMRRMRQPIVYAWFRKQELLYVGRSRNGLERIITARHHRLGRLLRGDRILAWTCPDADRAGELEAEIIRKLSPILNGNSKPAPDFRAARRPSIPKRVVTFEDLRAAAEAISLTATGYSTPTDPHRAAPLQSISDAVRPYQSSTSSGEK